MRLLGREQNEALRSLRMKFDFGACGELLFQFGQKRIGRKGARQFRSHEKATGVAIDELVILGDVQSVLKKDACDSMDETLLIGTGKEKNVIGRRGFFHAV